MKTQWIKVGVAFGLGIAATLLYQQYMAKKMTMTKTA